MGHRFPVYALGAALVGLLLLLLRISHLIVDLSEQKRRRLELTWVTEQLRYQSLHDPLTGLANRTLLYDRIEHALRQRIRQAGGGVAVLWLDLDGFKGVNDALGHDVGDRMLVEIARRLETLARDGDTVGRLGGDEFVLILIEVDAGHAVGVAERITRALATPIDLGMFLAAPRGSIGIALSDGSHDRASLLQQADAAMYEAKRHAPGRHQVFSAEQHAGALLRHELSTALKGAAARGELFLEYQPIMELATDRMIGVEALVRWAHPTLGVLPPRQWIPLAEASGAIGDIGAWVLAEACTQLQYWNARHPNVPNGPTLTMFVNLSARQLDEYGGVSRLQRVLVHSGVDPARIVLELTESAVATDLEATIVRLEQLKARGCRIAIDDLGTGFSSLSVLRKLPIDLIKIDKSFMDGVARDKGEWAFTTAIVAPAKSLGKGVIAEGIERGDQLAPLIALHCHYGQGDLFGQPVSASQISQLLDTAELGRKLPADNLDLRSR